MAASWQLKLGQRNYLFQFKWGFSLLCLVFFVLCCGLGNWQIHRYHFKKELLSNFQKNATQAPLEFSSVSNPLTSFQKIKVQGFYLNDLTMLVQNRYYHNVLGVEVLTPLKIKGEPKLMLIDRGWVPQKEIANLRAITAPQQVYGYIKSVDAQQFILGKNILTTQFPLMMQKIDIAEINRITQKEFFPFTLRLDPKAENGFVRDWIITTVEPERHLGYAIQWFLMALVLLIAYVCFCFERVNADYD